SHPPGFLTASEPVNGNVMSPPTYSFIPSPTSNPPMAETTVACGASSSTVQADPSHDAIDDSTPPQYSLGGWPPGPSRPTDARPPPGIRSGAGPPPTLCHEDPFHLTPHATAVPPVYWNCPVAYSAGACGPGPSSSCTHSAYTVPETPTFVLDKPDPTEVQYDPGRQRATFDTPISLIELIAPPTYSAMPEPSSNAAMHRTSGSGTPPRGVASACHPALPSLATPAARTPPALVNEPPAYRRGPSPRSNTPSAWIRASNPSPNPSAFAQVPL